MPPFVICWKQTHQKMKTVHSEYLRLSFELGRSISSHHLGKSQNHSNEGRSLVLLKLKQELENDAQINETVGNISNNGFIRKPLCDHKRPDKALLVAAYLLRITSLLRLRTHKTRHTLRCRGFRWCKQSRSGFRWRAHAHLRLQRRFGYLRHRFGARCCSERWA